MPQGRGTGPGPAKPGKLLKANLEYERPVQKKMILERAPIEKAPRVIARKSARGRGR